MEAAGAVKKELEKSRRVQEGEILRHGFGKPPPRFKVGDKVRIVKLLDDITSHELVGLIANIIEVDDIVSGDGDDGVRLQVNYYVNCALGTHTYVHDEELEAAGEDE